MFQTETDRNIESQMFSCFKDLKVEVSSKYLPLENIYKFIKCGDEIYPGCSTLKESTLRARQRLEAGDKAGYDQIKKQFSAITPHAYYPAERGKESEHKLSGVMMLDFDHLDKKEMEILLESSKKIESVILACKSLSGKGVHILIRCTPIAEEQFTLCYKALSRYAESVLGKAPDPSCKNINRLMIINYDPDAYYNPEAIPFDFSWVQWSNDYSLNKDFLYMNEKERLSRYLDTVNGNLNFTEGNRHNAIVSLTGTLNRAGFEESLVRLELCSRYEQPGFPSEEIERIVRSIYRDNASEHGTNKKTLPPETDKRTNGQLTSSGNNMEEPDENEVLRTPCPDVEKVGEYTPAGMLEHVIEPDDSPEVKFASMISLLTSLGAMMPNVTCPIGANEIAHPYLFLIVSGPAASGKSCIKRGTHIFNIHSDRIVGEDKAKCAELEQQYKNWERCMKKCKEEDCGCGSEPQKREPVRLSLSIHTSESKLVTHMANNTFHPTYLNDSELDRALNTRDFSLSAPLRQAYEGEPIGSHTHIHGDISVKNSKLAMCVAGTLAQVIRFLKNKEDGLTSRTVILFLPEEQKYKPICPSTAETYRQHEAKQKYLEGCTITFSKLLSQKRLFFWLGDETRKCIDKYFEDALKRYAPYSSDALRSFILRSRNRTVRIAMILATCKLYKEDQLQRETYELSVEPVKLVLSWTDYLIEQHIKLLSILPETETGGDGKEIKYKLSYDQLPCEFTFAEAKDIYGKYSNVTSKTVQRQLDSMTKMGLLEKVKHGTYRKVNCPDRDKAPTNFGDHPAFS